MIDIKNKKVKRLIFLSVTIIILLTAVILLLTRKSGTLSASEKNFAVKDTASITKIFLVDSYEAQTLLERTEQGWIVNGKYEIVKDNIDDLLSCIYNLVVKDIVAKSARNNINKRMATGSTKVEIYYSDYLIKAGKFKLFKLNKKKVYYIGDATMDNMGSYAIMEGSSIPCVVYLPGFRGFVTPKYSPREDSWRSHNIVRLKMSKIQEIKSMDLLEPANSFTILSNGNRNFDIMANNQRLSQYDTLRLLDFLSDFRDLNYEGIAFTLTKEEKDSIFARKFKEITIKDVENKVTTITMFYLEDEYEVVEDNNDAKIMREYNRDRFYAIVNGNKDEIFRCQYFVFDRIVQPLEFFYIDSKITNYSKVYEIGEDSDFLQ